jgi:hypothetical protein
MAGTCAVVAVDTDNEVSPDVEVVDDEASDVSCD